ncbi:Inosose dehydratase [Aquisphaera giovannonii]|uniref:Inosose dehydratase n=1 Tax=Aquisphaera giovannonii TaxID=406548 RepID=A0A5B9VX20_9BACT|nr:sugar phosphate isomerase/epimerase [Aquisphaera giovannonii]QEH32812.1 Inosose dehydratase [Aquisphaera giovannonii]
MSSGEHRGWTRRQVLGAGVAAAGLLTTGPARLLGGALREEEAGYGPFKVGLQSYSLRGYESDGKPDRAKALAVTRDLGLHHWEAFPAHVPVTEDEAAIKAMKSEFEAAGVHLGGYGVVALGKDERADRRIFEFAKAMGIAYISADPDPEGFALVDKLVDEYGIPVGIHNHGPGHRFALIDTIARAIKDHSPKIGCCIDTGHFLRSREDPVRAVEVFGDRIYGVHLKDVKDAETFTVLGRGDLRTDALLKALAGRKYSYNLALEYEEKPEDPVEDIKACLAALKKSVATLAAR